MPNQAQNVNENITLNDVQLASAYYPLLVELALQKQRLSYGGLVAMAKARHPESEVVKRALPVSTGRKLHVVRLFTSERGLPDLSCLIINRANGECGAGYTRNFDPEQARATVFAFDWSGVSNDFAGYIQHVQKAITPRPMRSRQEALNLMATYFSKNKAALPKSIRAKRELIIGRLEEGHSEEEAFAEALTAP